MATLTQHDLSILSKIKDPEASLSTPLLIDASLPRDPHLSPELYALATQSELTILTTLQKAEQQLLTNDPTSSSPLEKYTSCLTALDTLVTTYPRYASARNNRAQALRRIYGDGMLVSGTTNTLPALDESASETVLVDAASTTITDLDTAISLLTPSTPFAPISPQAAKTLAQAYTQRGALYHLSAKQLAFESALVRLEGRRESRWGVKEFEENASRDFSKGGRYGNEVAKALAVSTNPTAKLCGEMVREAMKREYGPGIGLG